MASIYEEVEIEDMTFDSEAQIYYYPCPCGDKFSIALSRFGMYAGQLRNPLKNNQKEPLKYNRILSRATAIAAYKVAGSVNTYG